MTSFVFRRATAMSLLLLACAIHAQKPKMDAKCQEILQQADAVLTKAKRMSVTQTRQVALVTGDTRQQMESEKTLILAARPNLFRVEKKGDSSEFTVSAGPEWIRYANLANAYQKTDVSKFATNALFRTPQVDSLVTTGRGLVSLWLGGHSLTTLLTGAETCTYAGTEDIDGTELHRVDAKLPQSRLSLFLSTGKPVLLMRVSTTQSMAGFGQKDDKGNKMHLNSELVFSDWKLDPTLPKDAFVFTPPENAKQVADLEKALAERIQTMAEMGPPTPAGKPFPCGPDACTQATFKVAERSWNNARQKRCYETHGQRDPKWDKAMLQFQAKWTERLLGKTSVPYLVELREQARYIQSFGCQDPLLKYKLANLTQYLSSDKVAEPLLEEAWKGLKNSSYPASSKIASVRRYRNLVKKTRRKDTELHARLQDQLSRLFAQATAEPDFADGNQRMFCFLFNYEWQNMALDGKKLAIETMTANPDVDPWLRAYYTGRYHIRKAWQARGAGYANSVSKKGWKGFSEHLQISKKELTAAWKLHPEFPEAPTEMITVAMAGHADESERVWFDRAIAGQLDWGAAYDKLRWSYRPRWGGKVTWIYENGLDSANTGRFDSNAPLFFWLALPKLREEGESWQAIMARPKAYETLRNVYKGYAAHNGPDYRPEYWQTVWLIGCWGAGNAKEALAALRQLEFQPDMVVCKNAKVDVDQLIPEVLLLAGSQGEAARRGLALLHRRRYAEAVPILRKIMLALRETEPTVYAYLGDRICEVRFSDAPKVASTVLDTMIDMHRREVLVQSFIRWMEMGEVPKEFQSRVGDYLGPISWAMMQEAPTDDDLTNDEIDVQLDRINAMTLADVPGVDTLPAEEAQELFISEQALAKLRLHYRHQPTKRNANKDSKEYCVKYVVSVVRSIRHRGMLLDFMGEHQKKGRYSYNRDVQHQLKEWALIKGPNYWDKLSASLLSKIDRLHDIDDPDQRIQKAWELFWHWGALRFGFKVKQFLDESGAEVDSAIMERHLLGYLSGLLIPYRTSTATYGLATGFNAIPGYENRVIGYGKMHQHPTWKVAMVRLAQADAFLRLGNLNAAIGMLVECEKANSDNDWNYVLDKRYRGSKACATALVQAIAQHPNATQETMDLLERLFPTHLAEIPVE
ncbi:MAG: DUF2092 domain-containing protein [Lentisphaeria bacterium]|nr:DUF2092 domain-containing protein [Lentisphaeria bacterium]